MLKPTNKPVSLGKESNFHSPSSTDLSVNSHTNPGSTEPNLASKMYMQLITVLGILIYLGLHCGFYADFIFYASFILRPETSSEGLPPDQYPLEFFFASSWHYLVLGLDNLIL